MDQLVPLPDGALDNPIAAMAAAKTQEVMQAGLEKRAAMSNLTPAQQLLKEFQKDAATLSNAALSNRYGATAAKQALLAENAKNTLHANAVRKRTFDELGNDIPLQIASGGANLVAGTAVLAQDAVAHSPELNLLAGAAGMATGKDALGALDKARTAVILPQQKMVGRFNQMVQDAGSSVTQADSQVMGQENADAAAQHLADYNAAVDGGANAVPAAAARVAKDYAHDALNMLGHTTSLTNSAIQQLPTYAIGGIAKAGVSAEQMLAGSVARLAKRGIGEGTSMLEMKAVTEARRQTMEALTHANTRALVTATEMGSNYGQSAGDIANAPIDSLKERFPAIQQQLDAGVSEDYIRQELASKTGLTAAAITAPIAYGSSYLSQDFLAHPIGKGFANTLKKFGNNVLEQAGEVTEESLQGAGGQLSQNIANRASGDQTATDLLAGVGGAAGQGGAAALGAAGAMRAPGLVVGGTALAGKGAMGALKLGVKGVAAAVNATGRPDKVRAAQAEDVAAQQEATQTARTADATTLSEGFTAEKTPAADGAAPKVSPAAEVATAPVESSPLLTPKDVSELKGADNTDPMNTVTALSKALNILTVVNGEDKATDTAHQTNLKLFAVSSARSLRQHLDTITDPKMREAANRLLGNQHLAEMEDAFKDIPDKLIQDKVDTLPKDTIPAGTELTPDVKQALGQIAEIAAQAPEKLSVAQTKGALFHSEHLSPSQKSDLEQAHALATIREAVTANVEKLSTDNPDYAPIKTAAEVSDGIFKKPFPLNGKELPSLNDMTRVVVQALGNGKVDEAMKAIKQMRVFAKGRIQRASDFNKAAHTYIENGATGRGAEVANTRQLATATTLAKEPNFVNTGLAKSRLLVDTVHLEAQAAAGMFNELVKAHPELNQKALTASADSEPTYKALLKDAPVTTPGSAPAINDRVSSAVRNLQPQVDKVAKYASKLKADANPGKVKKHIATLESVIKSATKSLKATVKETAPNQHKALTSLIDQAQGALTLLTAHRDTKPAAAPAGESEAATSTTAPAADDPAAVQNEPVSVLNSVKAAMRSPVFKALGSLIKSLNKKQFGKEDLAKLQAIADQLSKGFSIPRAIVGDTFSEKGRLGEYDPKNHTISIRTDGTLKTHEAVTTFLHEYAHHITVQLLGIDLDSGHPLREALYKDYLAWKDAHAPDATKGDVRSSRAPFFRNLYDMRQADEGKAGVDPRMGALDSAAFANALSEHEYIADMIARTLYEHLPTQGIVQDAFTKVAKAMRLMFQLLRSYDPRIVDTPESFKEFIRAQWQEPAVEPASSESPKTVAERFPGLAETMGVVPEGATAAKALPHQNKFLSSFKLALKAQGLFTRFADPMAELKAAFEKGVKGVQGLYVESLKYLKPTEAQVEALDYLLTTVAPTIAEQMNKHLLATAEGQNSKGWQKAQYISRDKAIELGLAKESDPVTYTDKDGNEHRVKYQKPATGLMGYLFNPVEGKAPQWSFENRLALYMTEWGHSEDGTRYVRYQPGIAAAVGLAAVHWAMNQQNAPVDYNEEKLDKRYPGMTEDLRDHFKTMHYKDRLLQSLAGDITQVLGIRANNDASQSYTEALPLALAQQAMIAMEQLGFLKVVPVKAGMGNADTTFTFIEMNKASPAENDKNGTFGLQSFRDALEQPALITRLLMPDSKTLPSIGKPSSHIDGSMSRTNQQLSKIQLRAVEKYGKVPYWVNTHLISDMKALGKDAWLELRGYDSRPLDQLNRTHARTITGKNLSLEMAWDGIMELEGQVGQYADEHAAEDGSPMENAPIYYSVHFGSNTRMFMNATLNPQGDKDVREAIVNTLSKYDFAADPKHKALWFSAIGQALDLGKMEQIASPEKFAEIVADRMAKKDMTKVIEAWQAMQAAEPGSSEQKANVKKVRFLLSKVFEGESIPAHALHAISDYARYQASTDKGSFTSSLPIEIDGKTDGPFHAIWHLGLWNFGKHTLRQLRQGGGLLNTLQRSLNEMGKSQGDMYIHVGDNAKDLIQAMLGKAKEGGHTVRGKAIHASVELLRMVGHIEVTRGDDGKPVGYKVTRSPGKLFTTPMIYGSSAASAMKTLGGAIIDEVYSQISEAMKEGNPPLSPRLQERLHLMMAKYNSGPDPVTGKDVWLPTPHFDLSDQSTYRDFKFDAKHRQALVDNLKQTAGGALAKSVQAELADVIDPESGTFGQLYKAAAFQMFQYKTEFNAAREELRKQRIEEGTLGPKDALSKNDEQAILKELNAKAPIYQLIHSAGLSKDFGISIARPEAGGRHIVDGVEQKVRPLGAGDLSMHIPSANLKEAGVRIAALLVQGLGDASMITELGLDDPNGMLPVFDGLGISPLEMAKWGTAANQAVLKSVRFNGLKSVTDSFANSDMDFYTVGTEGLLELLDALHVDKETKELFNTHPEGLASYLTNNRADLRSRLERRAQKIAFTKAALLDEGISQASIDHMAGAGVDGAVHLDGQLMEDPVFIARIVERVAAQMAKAYPVVNALGEVVERTAATAATAKPKNVSEVLANLSQEGLKTLDNAEIQSVIKNQGLIGNVRQFVYKQIAHLLPANLQVHIGTHAQIAAKQAELFGEALGTEQDVGATLENHIFIKNNSEETLVHELVHAAVGGLLNRFYEHGGKGLNKAQKDAITELEKMTRIFATADDKKVTTPGVANALKQVRGELDANRIEGAVNEFLAWTLSNRDIQDGLVQSKASKFTQLKALGKTVLDLVRRALGLPKNVPMDSFLGTAMGQFRRLTVRAPINDGLTPSGTVAFQSLAGSEDKRLEQLNDDLTWLRTHLPNDGLQHPNKVLRTVREQNRDLAASKVGETLRKQFEDAGFHFSEAGRLVFEQMQTVMATTMQLDSSATEGMQQLYTEAMANLSAKDFLSDPNDTSEQAWKDADARYDALLGIGNQTADSEKRSNLLANFVALALVDESLREKLAAMTPEKVTVDKSTFDKRMRSGVTAIFNYFIDLSDGTVKAPNQLAVLDQLVQRLAANQKAALLRQNAGDGPMTQAENYVKRGTAALGRKAEAKRQENLTKADRTGLDKMINGVLLGVTSMASKEGSSALGESLISMANQLAKRNYLSKLLAEMIGRIGSNEKLINLLDEGKTAVARVRQRLREEAPAQVRALFKNTISKETWTVLHKSVARTGLADLVGVLSPAQMKDVMTNPAALQTAIADIESQFTKHSDRYSQAAKDRAHQMVNRKASSKHFLYPNAKAMSRLLGSNLSVSETLAKQMEPLLDQLISLRAIEALREGERQATAELLASDPDGMSSLLQLIKTLSKNESDKALLADQHYNIPKGYVPESLDPRSQLILANTDKAAELLKKGYRFAGHYMGDTADPDMHDVAYYAIDHIGGQASYSQGALQTVENTVGGLAANNGRSNDVALQTMITHPRIVAGITTDKAAGQSSAGNNLVPLFNKEGEIYAYQRTIDPSMIDKHLRGNKDLTQAIGSWLGRQAEEIIAKQVNTDLAKVLHERWMGDSANKRGNEFVNIANATDKVMQDSWNTIPAETQKLLKETFAGPGATTDQVKNAPVWVRKEQLDNAIGYRAASIGDVFTGMTDLDPKVQKALTDTAYAFMGKNAYRNLVAAERALQGVVGFAKETIVVRSLTVGLNNLTANQFQLMMHGVPPWRLHKLQAAKARELETHLRYEKRLTQIGLELASTTDQGTHNKLKREEQLLHDASSRLSIAPLIGAGELPSIAEDLSEHDEYTIMNDFSGWLEEKTKDFPPGLITAAKYAAIAKGTPLHQGLNRLVQFGDFMAKAVLYDTMIEKGTSREEALSYVNDRFVNYNLLSGRTRDYMEKVGLTWFWNYKIRIQKVIFATIRDNPLRFLMSGAAGGALDVNTLMSDNALNTNWQYTIGWGQLFHSQSMLMWRQGLGL